MKTIQQYSIALFGKESSTNVAKVLVNKNGDAVGRPTVHNWFLGKAATPQWALDQLNEECKKRLVILQNMVD